MFRVGGENMKIIDLEYACIDVNSVKLIYEPISVPVKTYIRQLKELENQDVRDNKFLNLTFGSATNTYIELNDGRVIATSFPLKALYERIKDI